MSPTGSAQVARALARVLPACGWQVALASGSLGEPGAPTHAASFYEGVEVTAVDYSPALRLADPLAAAVPFQPSYEDRSASADRVFAMVDDAAYERLVATWTGALARAGAARADLLHLHHLTPAHEAALRAFPWVPILGQLHGTELAFLRWLRAGPPPAWRHARAWEQRLRRWASGCARLIVPRGAEAEVASLLGLEGSRLHGLPSGVELERFQPRPLAGEARLAFWRRWLVYDPQGWDEQGTPGSVAYRSDELPALGSETVLLYLGRFTAVKRLPLLIEAHQRAQAEVGRDLPLVLVGGHPGEWEGRASARNDPHARRAQRLPRRLAAPRAASGGAERRRLARVALGRGGIRARPDRSDGLRPPRDRLRRARPGRNRPGRRERLARGTRRRTGARDGAQPRRH